MAKSGLESSLSPLGSLQGSSAEDSYQEARQNLKQALDARQNRLFDPQLLAIAQGFLSPTKTGSFGESLGQAAGNVIPVQQAEEKANLDMAQLRLQVAQADRAQALKDQGMAFLSGNLQGQLGGQLSGQKTSSGPAEITKGDSSGVGIMINGKAVTPALIAQLKFSNKELGEALETQYKLSLDDISVQPGGYTKKSTGVYTPFGGKPLVERVIPELNSIVKMSEQDAMELDEARRSGNGQKYYEIVDRNTKKMSRDAASAVPASSTTTAGGAVPASANKAEQVDDKRTTVSSMEADSAAEKERATVMAKSEAERTNLVKDAGRAARASQIGYERAEKILDTPGIEKAMGLVNKGDIASAITNFVTDSVKVGNYTVGIPAFKKVLSESNVPQDVLNKLLELGQIEAMWQMETRKGLGSGTSVSNMEQMMANRMTPSSDDPIGAYKSKLRFLQEKAKFDAQLSREMSKANMGIDQFEQTDAFDKIFRSYADRLNGIVSGEAKSQKTNAATQTGPITAESLRNRLNPPR